MTCMNPDITFLWLKLENRKPTEQEEYFHKILQSFPTPQTFHWFPSMEGSTVKYAMKHFILGQTLPFRTVYLHKKEACDSYMHKKKEPHWQTKQINFFILNHTEKPKPVIAL